jgi:hypothetical protein
MSLNIRQKQAGKAAPLWCLEPESGYCQCVQHSDRLARRWRPALPCFSDQLLTHHPLRFTVCALPTAEVLHRILNFNSKDSSAESYKVLVLDRFTKDIIAPLLRLNDLRKHGVTLHLMLENERQPIPDVPAVYFVQPSQPNVERIVADAVAGLYESMHLNFTLSINSKLVEQLAAGVVKAGCLQRVSKVYDQYTAFVALEATLFSLGLPDAYLELNDPHARDYQIEVRTQAHPVSLHAAARPRAVLTRPLTGSSASLPRAPMRRARPMRSCPAACIHRTGWLSRLSPPPARPPSRARPLQAAVSGIVDGLFSVCVTLGVVPVIRCPRGGAAEHIAGALDAKLRDALKSRNNLLSEGVLGLSASLSRPLLCLFDRNFDLSAAVQHSWTYKPLVQDVLGLRLNRIALQSEAAGPGPGAMLAANAGACGARVGRCGAPTHTLLLVSEEAECGLCGAGSCAGKKHYDVDEKDFFWEACGAFTFPKARGASWALSSLTRSDSRVMSPAARAGKNRPLCSAAAERA